jgi:phenylpropionate dioxygenase-like ring-hydroxylating dioxygenase large terminal subunit
MTNAAFHATDITVPAGSFAPLPSSAFSEPAFYAREQAMFRRLWNYVGLTASLAERGSYQLAEVAGVPIMLVRGQDDRIRAFVNVCPHRGAILVESASGVCSSFTCRYHAWHFGLDGGLRGAPWSREDPQFDRSAVGLHELPVELFGPFIFTTLHRDPEPLSASYGDWMESMAPCLDTLRQWLKPWRRVEYSLDCNWKILLENGLECYHCAPAHPQLAEILDVRQYRIVNTFSSALKYKAIPREGDPHPDFVHPLAPGVNFLWPNIFLGIDEPSHSVIVATNRPVAVDRCVHIREYCFGDDVSESEREAFVAFQHSIFEQDIPLCESVHRGLATRTLARPRLLGDIEDGLRYFEQRLLDELERP